VRSQTRGGRIGQAGGHSEERWSKAASRRPSRSHVDGAALRQGRRQADGRPARQAQGAVVNGFVLFVVGEGIEKKKDDFAAEVAAMAKT
jgi:hypothetical protein